MDPARGVDAEEVKCVFVLVRIRYGCGACGLVVCSAAENARTLSAKISCPPVNAPLKKVVVVDVVVVVVDVVVVVVVVVVKPLASPPFRPSGFV